MQNGIIKGQGNSRWLKSGIGSNTTWEQFLASLIAGTLPIDLNGINEDGWDQLGTPLNKATLLSDATETEIFGNTQDRTVDDAFIGLLAKIQLIMQNVANMTLTVTDTNGTPLSGVYVNGVFDDHGDTMATNTSGQIAGYVAEGTTTLSISGYGDISNYSEQFTAVKGESYTKAISVTTRNFLKLTSSQNIKFSGNVTRVDVTVVGGGGGGGAGSSLNEIGGGGGGGGFCSVSENVSFSPNTTYQAVVGSGGTGDGGNSSFLGVTANGGTAGSISAGGIGNGNGGAPSANRTGYSGGDGNTMGYDSFTTMTRYGGGGGGGVGGGDLLDGGGGGAGYGGAGGEGRGGDAQNGTNGFGGGGGGSGAYHYELIVNGESHGERYVSGDPGKGGSGCIAMRMHLASAA